MVAPITTRLTPSPPHGSANLLQADLLRPETLTSEASLTCEPPTSPDTLAEWELNLPCPKLKRVLETRIGLQIISREAANEIAAALGVGE